MPGRRTGGQADGQTIGQLGAGAVVTLSPSAALRAGCAKGPGLFARFIACLQAVAGMPDYAAHVEHLRRHHPGTPVPTPRAFYEEYLRSRYGDGPTRCC